MRWLYYFKVPECRLAKGQVEDSEDSSQKLSLVQLIVSSFCIVQTVDFTQRTSSEKLLRRAVNSADKI